MMILYHALSTLAVLIAAPFTLIHSFATGKKRKGVWHRLGIVPQMPEAETADAKTVWLHALSLGEVRAARPILTALREKAPALRIAVSVTTDSGFQAAEKQLDVADRIFFHPFDGYFCNRMALKRIRPDLFVLMDTGFWPGFLHQLQKQHIPALLFNGRISQRSLRRYQFFGSFFSGVFNRFDFLGMHNNEGAAALRDLGVAPERVKVMGDSKFDGLKTFSLEEKNTLRTRLRIPERCRVWVAGSTHEGEEKIVLKVFRILKTRIPDVLLILAPRRLERIGDITALLTRLKIPFARRSKLHADHPEVQQVLLLDTMGELMSVYAIADIAFVGKSLLPPGGGHSLMEPISCGIPVLHGPHIENLGPLAEELRQQGYAFPVRDGKEMGSTLQRLLNDEKTRSRLAVGAPALIRNYQGASRRMADVILERLRT